MAPCVVPSDAIFSLATTPDEALINSLIGNRKHLRRNGRWALPSDAASRLAALSCSARQRLLRVGVGCQKQQNMFSIADASGRAMLRSARVMSCRRLATTTTRASALLKFRGRCSTSGAKDGATFLDRCRDVLNPFGNAIVTCGSIGLVTAYAMEDVLHLRLSAIFGTSSFVLFYLVQKPIMVTPAAWGCLNLSINAYMTARILLARQPVTFTEQELDVYEEHFRPFGCSARSFRLFWDAGRRRTYRAGEVIQQENEVLTSLSLVISGRVERSTGGNPIPALSSYPGARNANPDGCDAGAWIGELGLVQTLNGSERQARLGAAKTTAEAPMVAAAAAKAAARPHGKAEGAEVEERDPLHEAASLQRAERSHEPSPRLGALQRRLSVLGFYDGTLDAQAGPKTETAVKEFQRASGLKVDGVLGPQTKALLEAASVSDAELVVHSDNNAGRSGSGSRSVFTSRAAADAIVVSWTFGDVTKLCALHPDLQQELRRAFSHSATVKALGLARHANRVS